MNSKNANLVLGAIAIIFIAVVLHSNRKMNERIKELENALNSNSLISEKIKEQLLDLLARHPHIDEDVKQELSQIALLIGIQQESKAILSLTKIIENLLKNFLKEDTDFKTQLKKKSKPVFADYLDYAKNSKLISTHDYHLISVLKGMRNEEAHELNVATDRGKLVGCFISGVSVVLTLYNMIKKKHDDARVKTAQA